jgi:PTS system nitrogen regulatory IIA component
MKLNDHLSPNLINLDLQSSTKEEILQELISILEIENEYKPILLEMVLQREQLGSTGIGGGVAIPHGRSVIVNRLHLVFGLSKKGIYYKAMDKKKVFLFFLVVAPHREVSNQYLPLLGNIARLASNPENVNALRKVKSPQKLIEALEKMDV